MKRGILLRYPASGWAPTAFADLFPGAHAVVFGGYRFPLEVEDAGFEVRDSITMIGPKRHQVWLLRKPVEAGNVAAQVLKTGTGGIWIDGCRVTTSPEDREQMLKMSEGFAGKKWGDTHFNYGYETSMPTKTVSVPSVHGRWPTNLVLVHGPGCRRDGVPQIPGHKGYPNGPGGKSHHYRSDKRSVEVRPNAWVSPATNADGLETIASWICEPGCQVRKLDEQSGDRPTGALREYTRTTGDTIYALGMTKEGQVSAPGWDKQGDSGGASRFFPQFADEAELDAWLRRLILGSESV